MEPVNGKRSSGEFLIDWNSPDIPSNGKPLIPIPSLSNSVMQSMTDDNPFDAVERQTTVNGDPFDILRGNRIDDILGIGKLEIGPEKKLDFNESGLLDITCLIKKRIRDCVLRTLNDYNIYSSINSSQNSKDKENTLIEITNSDVADRAENKCDSSQLGESCINEDYIMQLSTEELVKYVQDRIENCVQTARKNVTQSGNVRISIPTTDNATSEKACLYSTLSPKTIVGSVKCNGSQLFDDENNLFLTQTPVKEQEFTSSLNETLDGIRYEYRCPTADILAYRNSLRTKEVCSDLAEFDEDCRYLEEFSFSTTSLSALSSPVAKHRVKRSASFEQLPIKVLSRFHHSNVAEIDKILPDKRWNSEINSSEEDITKVVPDLVDDFIDTNDENVLNSTEHLIRYKNSVAVASHMNVKYNSEDDNLLGKSSRRFITAGLAEKSNLTIKKPESTKMVTHRSGPMKALIPLQDMTKMQLNIRENSSRKKNDVGNRETIPETPKLESAKQTMKPVASSTPAGSKIASGGAIYNLGNRRSVPNNTSLKTDNSGLRSSSSTRVRAVSPDCTSNNKFINNSSHTRSSRQVQSIAKHVARNELTNNNVKSALISSKRNSWTSENSLKFRSKSPLVMLNTNRTSVSRSPLVPTKVNQVSSSRPSLKLQSEVVKRKPIPFNRFQVRGKENYAPQ